MSAPFAPATRRHYTAVHMFSGSGGCTSGFDEEGFETLAAIDSDADACADLDYLLNKKVAVQADISKMDPAELRRICGDRRPDVYVETAPCKGWSQLLSKNRRRSMKYVAMCSLAVRGVWLALYAWDEPPPLIVIENVRGMATEGRELMNIIKRELKGFGYLFDVRTHNVGKLGNLAQSRERCLFVARDPKRCPAWLMVPDEHPLRPCGDELGKLPPPIMDARSESMHRLPQLSARNWLRIAAIRAGKDWKDLPARIRLGGKEEGRHDSKFGVERWDRPVHTVVGVGNRVPSGWSAIQDTRAFDPQVRAGGATEPRNGNYGVEDPSQPAHTIRGEHRVWSAPASFADHRLGGHQAPAPAAKPRRARKAAAGQGALFDLGAVPDTDVGQPHLAGDGIDPRVDDHGGDRQNGGFGVNAWGAPAHTIVGRADVSNAIRGHMEVRQAPGAIAAPFGPPRSDSVVQRTAPDGESIDPRVDWDPDEHGGRPHNYGVQEWTRPSSTIRGKQTTQNSRASVAHPDYPVPTHRLVYDAAGELVLLGPPITDWDEICYLVIQSPDGSWHRPMTDLELAVLQSLPAEHNGAMLALRGPSGKRREHIGNMLPKHAARAIARSCRATLDQPEASFELKGSGKIWVRRDRRPELRGQLSA